MLLYGSLAYKNKYQTIPKLVDKIKEILDKFKNDKRNYSYC